MRLTCTISALPPLSRSALIDLDITAASGTGPAAEGPSRAFGSFFKSPAIRIRATGKARTCPMPCTDGLDWQHHLNADGTCLDPEARNRPNGQNNRLRLALRLLSAALRLSAVGHRLGIEARRTNFFRHPG